MSLSTKSEHNIPGLEELKVSCDENSVLKIDLKKTGDTCRNTWKQEISHVFFTKQDTASVSYRVKRKVLTGKCHASNLNLKG